MTISIMAYIGLVASNSGTPDGRLSAILLKGESGIERVMIHSYAIAGMHCRNCVQKVTKALESVPGVSNATVTLDPPEARVEMSSHVASSRLSEAVKNAGDYSLREKEALPHGSTSAASATGESPQSLKPLFIILGYILGGVLLRFILAGGQSLHLAMQNFMGGFFAVFSLFKMINLAGFADAYGTYDIIAKRSRGYALAYPFIELLLGCFYFAGIVPLLTNVLTASIMGVGAVGVAQALLTKRTIQCACLGTALNLPMTKVTLAEDAVMGVMALVMLLMPRAV